MKFTARIKAGSHIERSWLQHKRVSGIVGGVLFRLKHRRFISDELEAEQILGLKDNPAIELEAMATMKAVEVPVVVKAPKPKGETQPSATSVKAPSTPPADPSTES